MGEVQSQEHCGLTHLLLSAGGTKGRYPVSGLQPSICDTKLHRSGFMSPNANKRQDHKIPPSGI